MPPGGCPVAGECHRDGGRAMPKPRAGCIRIASGWRHGRTPSGRPPHPAAPLLRQRRGETRMLRMRHFHHQPKERPCPQPLAGAHPVAPLPSVLPRPCPPKTFCAPWYSPSGPAMTGPRPPEGLCLSGGLCLPGRDTARAHSRRLPPLPQRPPCPPPTRPIPAPRVPPAGRTGPPPLPPPSLPNPATSRPRWTCSAPSRPRAGCAPNRNAAAGAQPATTTPTTNAAT